MKEFTTYEYVSMYVCVCVHVYRCVYVCAFKTFGLNSESFNLYTVPWNQQLFWSDKRQYNFLISLVPSTEATHFGRTDIFKHQIHEI